VGARTTQVGIRATPRVKLIKRNAIEVSAIECEVLPGQPLERAIRRSNNPNESDDVSN